MRGTVACLAVLLAACTETTEPTVPETHVTVPGGFHIARNTPGHRAHLALTGDKKVSCHDCHAIADAGFASPGVELCAQCHERNEQQHHPLVTTADGGTITCFTCHPFTAASPAVRFETWSCMDCHRERQGLDAGAITTHTQGCPSCHRPHQKPFTEPSDCHACHDVNVHHGGAKELLPSECGECHQPHRPAEEASEGCETCHAGPTIATRLKVQHGLLWKGGHEGCGSCHPTHAFTRAEVRLCTGCHVNQPVMGDEAHSCVGCHRPHEDRARPVACETCHQDVKKHLGHPKSAEGQTCTGCHAPHPKSPAPAALAAPCTSCHTKAPFDAKVVHADDTACDDCHKPHEGKPAPQKLCVNCHENEVVLTSKNDGHQKCVGCHTQVPHGAPDVAPKECLSCHETRTPPQKGHPPCLTCHEPHSGKPEKTCVGCHLAPGKPPLPGLHAVAKHQDCLTCHAPHTPEPDRGPKTCMGCHKKLTAQEHPTQPKQCATCHLFRAPPKN